LILQNILLGQGREIERLIEKLVSFQIEYQSQIFDSYVILEENGIDFLNLDDYEEEIKQPKENMKRLNDSSSDESRLLSLVTFGLISQSK